ncbi:MAG TPA: hypothetical protein VK810_03280 [Dongiaceae bacterium]|nr:hypothetical protein [Dongiaceae bacterium]
MSSLPFVRLWLWISALASLAGWTLSALRQLNCFGYAIFFVALAVFVFLRRKDFEFVPANKFSRRKKFLRRFKRPLPLCFAALVFLIFLGGALYAPVNYAALTYRVPRVLQWLSHGHWFWIHTTNYRMNDRACGIEWLSAPVLLFTNSTRLLFLLNFLPFLLLPGLIFSVFTRLGVRARIAWQWMWLLPTGYNFILQAGSIGNDTFPAIYALAAIDFGLRAWKSRNLFDLWNSILAAALLIGAKASNLPLLLPWAILILPLIPLLRKKIIVTALIIVLAAIASFLPMAVLNAHYCGDWSGAKLEPPALTVKNPLIGIGGNTFQILLDNFAPPFFPQANWWNQNAPRFFPHTLVSISNDFDTGFFQLGELPTEDWAGLGLGVSILLSVSVLASFWIHKRKSDVQINQTIPSAFCKLIMLAAWVSLLAFCVKSGLTTTARLISPYYPLLIPLLVVGAAQSEIVHRRWWRVLVCGNLIFAFAVLILTPGRELFPAQTILSKLAAQNPGSHLLSRAQKVYSTYANRSDPLACVRDLLPQNISTVGFAGGPDDADISLWQPFGTRRVEQFLLADSPAQIRSRQIRYAVISGMALDQNAMTLDAWLNNSGAEWIATTNAILKVSGGEQQWHVVRFKN